MSGAKDRTIHDLRHTFASLSISKGVPIVNVSHYLGHEKPSFTLSVYTHYIENSGVNPSAVISGSIKCIKKVTH